MESYKPMLFSSIYYWAIAGVAGMPVLNAYNGLVSIINDIWPEYRIRTLQGLMMAAHVPPFLQMAGMTAATHLFPEWVQQGPLNEATRLIPGNEKGTYASGPMGAVSAAGGLSPATIPFVDAMKDIAILAGRAVASAAGVGSPITASDVYKVGMPLVPQPLRPFVQKAMQPENSDVVGSNRSMEGKYRADSADWFSKFMFGRPSLDEQINSDKERQVKLTDTQDKATLKRLVDIGVNAAQGRGGDVNEAVKEALNRNLIASPKEFYQAVQDGITGERTTSRERDAEARGVDARRREKNRFEMDQP
jgi:hypothetical protein